MPFNIGPGELILVLILALIIVGPGKLPDVGAAIGRSLREFRRAASDVNDATSVPSTGQAAASPAPNVLGAAATPNTLGSPEPGAMSAGPAGSGEPAPAVSSSSGPAEAADAGAASREAKPVGGAPAQHGNAPGSPPS
jgi:TatA/E family protein of Tat protein translocase